MVRTARVSAVLYTWQTPGAEAQILHALVRSQRETLVVCLVRWCRLACSKYTLFPIMSIKVGLHQVHIALALSTHNGLVVNAQPGTDPFKHVGNEGPTTIGNQVDGDP